MTSKLAPLFFDLDHTLWDFETNSRLALRRGVKDLALLSHGLASEQEWIAHYEAANDWCWAQFRAGEMTKSTLRAKRFAMAMERCGMPENESLARQLGEHYLDHSPYQTALIPGTLDMLECLASRGHAMWVLTNGFEEVQHIKVENSGLDGFFRGVYTSDALSVKKPNPEAYRRAASLAKVEMDAGVIMIGDSLESDVLGAQAVGWRGVHFAPGLDAHPESWKTIEVLEQLKDLPLHV